MRHEAARLAAIGALLAFVFPPDPAAAQAGTSEALVHVVIPFLASATNPSDLSFEGAECERNPASNTMECEFQQVFLTTSDVVPDTCLVTTNRYQRVFRWQSNTLWTSTEGPTGECDVLDVVTLQDDGGVRWTMTIRKTAGRAETPACRLEEASETLGWQNLRRPLPCRFVQPGGLSR
jgi:hypothetical protein